MRGATSASYSDQPAHVKLKVWSKTGFMLEEVFPSEKTTFADVKYFAIRQLLVNNNSSNNHHSLSNYRRSSFNTIATNRNNPAVEETENYKLISITSKRAVEEDKSLRQQNVKDGDEFLLATSRTMRPSKTEKPVCSYTVDAELIESRTQDLPKPSRLLNRDYRSGARTEFRTDLNRILITLIETSQKLLWCHPDAENIFKQAEEFFLRSAADESTNHPTTSTTSDDRETRRQQISKLTDMGFTDKQARIGLKRTRYDLHAAMELLINQADTIDDDEDDESDHEQQADDDHKTPEIVRTPLYSRNGPFISFRKFRQQRFQPDPKAIQSLKEIGFAHEDIVVALRMFNNDKNLACEYLLSDRQQQQTMNDAETDEGLDSNSSIFQSIMQNAIVQRTLNTPKTFFIMLQIAENPTSITNYLNDPDIGNMLLQISRIYHAEKENMNVAANQRHDSDQPEENLSRTTGSLSGDFDDDDEYCYLLHIYPTYSSSIMAAASGVEKLQGTWEYVDGEHFDDYMKELGVGFALRQSAKLVKPKLIISQNGDSWTLKSESSLKSGSYDFTPDVEFDETRLDGEVVKSTIRFENDKWIHTSRDKSGKESIVTRYVDNQGQHQIEMKSGKVTARRWYKRAE